MTHQVLQNEIRVMSAVTVRQASHHPWGVDNWVLAGVIPGLSAEQLKQCEQQGELHIWPDLKVTLYPQHCDAYYQNLTSKQPMIYLVCHQNESQLLNPFLMTVDHDEAASYMETGAWVLTAPLPEELCLWLEQFVIEHYQPQKMEKRRRERWGDDEVPL